MQVLILISSLYFLFFTCFIVEIYLWFIHSRFRSILYIIYQQLKPAYYTVRPHPES